MGSSATGSPPLGIKIICALGVLGAILVFVISLQLVALGGPGVPLGGLFIGLTVAYLVVIYGLWTMQSWGWTWGMIVFVFGAILELLQFEIISLFISIVIIVYLYSKRDLYREQRTLDQLG